MVIITNIFITIVILTIILYLHDYKIITIREANYILYFDQILGHKTVNQT